MADQVVKTIRLDKRSRSHADLRLDSTFGGLSFINLGSRNGTFVDGVRNPADSSV